MTSCKFNQVELAALGARLKRVREISGKSQPDFAATIGASFRSYADYERGITEIRTRSLRLLCLAYRVCPLWVLEGPGPEPVDIWEGRPHLEP